MLALRSRTDQVTQDFYEKCSIFSVLEMNVLNFAWNLNKKSFLPCFFFFQTQHQTLI